MEEAPSRRRLLLKQGAVVGSGGSKKSGSSANNGVAARLALVTDQLLYAVEEPGVCSGWGEEPVYYGSSRAMGASHSVLL